MPLAPTPSLLKLHSLGLRSDLSLIDGELLDRGDYLVVRSPKQPRFYWGNLLVFPDPPGPGAALEWPEIFAREFAGDDRVEHQTFTWDIAAWDLSSEEVVAERSSTEEVVARDIAKSQPIDLRSKSDGQRQEIAAFESAGFHLEQTVVLTASELVPPPHPNRALEVRVIESEADWQEVAELQVACREAEHEEARYRAFVRDHLVGLRARIDAGQGQWYGAFLAGRQVGNLGIIRSGSLGRFQQVVTHPEFRGQGVCGTLVHHVASRTLARPEIESLVMLADQNYHAARIYESVGFAASERLEGLCRWPS